MQYTVDEVNKWFANAEEQTKLRKSLIRLFNFEEEVIEDALQEFWLFATNEKTLIDKKYKLAKRAIYFCRAHNYTHFMRRQAKHTAFEEWYLEGSDLFSMDNPELQYLREESKLKLNSYVAKLPKIQQQTLSTIFTQSSGRDLTKIAVEEGKDYNTFKANYRHAMNSLKKRMKRPEEFFLDLDPSSDIIIRRHKYEQD